MNQEDRWGDPVFELVEPKVEPEPAPQDRTEREDEAEKPEKID
jgi:hypothetical protein